MKARIVAKTLRLGASGGEVGWRNRLKANHVSSWWTPARKGRLVLGGIGAGGIGQAGGRGGFDAHPAWLLLGRLQTGAMIANVLVSK